MYVVEYMCVHVHMRTCAYTCVHVRACVRVRAHVHVYRNKRLCTGQQHSMGPHDVGNRLSLAGQALKGAVEGSRADGPQMRQIDPVQEAAKAAKEFL